MMIIIHSDVHVPYSKRQHIRDGEYSWDPICHSDVIVLAENVNIYVTGHSGGSHMSPPPPPPWGPAPWGPPPTNHNAIGGRVKLHDVVGGEYSWVMHFVSPVDINHVRL